MVLTSLMEVHEGLVHDCHGFYGERGRSRSLGGLVQGLQQVTALEQVKVALHRNIDLTVIAGQLGQVGALKRGAQQTAHYTCTHRNNWVLLFGLKITHFFILY